MNFRSKIMEFLRKFDFGPSKSRTIQKNTKKTQKCGKVRLATTKKRKTRPGRSLDGTKKRVHGHWTRPGRSLNGHWMRGPASCAGPAEGGGAKLPKECGEFACVCERSPCPTRLVTCKAGAADLIASRIPPGLE